MDIIQWACYQAIDSCEPVDESPPFLTIRANAVGLTAELALDRGT
ncbi:hypothetical protein [Haloquadratum walsbyi]|nr:hypothetical protein [Haloquadratum walsbyi]